MLTRWICIIIFSLMLFACKGEENVLVPEDPPITAASSIKMSPFGNILDSLYVKVWSDSSVDEFAEMRTINGIQFLVTRNSAGHQYFYSTSGYAGLQPAGENPILFDTPLRIQDSLFFGVLTFVQTTFYYKGYAYTMRQEYTLRDTVRLSLPFGYFDGCAHLSTKVILSAGGQTETTVSDVWLAKGPSTVKETKSSGITTVMVRGRVNGRGWGMAYPKLAASAAHDAGGNASMSPGDFLDAFSVHHTFLRIPR